MAAPESVIAVLLPPLYNQSERAFRLNYNGKYPRWRQLRNRARFIELMVQLARTRQDVKLVPTNLFVDPIEGYPSNNALHFNALVAKQIAGSVFSWMMGDLAGKVVLQRE